MHPSDSSPFSSESSSSQSSGRNQRAQRSQIRHDLRSPLNAILGYSEMLLEDTESLDEVAQAQLQYILNQGNEMLQHINQTLLSQDQALALEDESEDVSERLPELEATLKGAIATILSTCDALRSSSNVVDAEGDLEKIVAAAQHLSLDLPMLLDRYREYQHQAYDFQPGIDPSPALLQEAERTLSRLNFGSVQTGSSNRILVVDDNEANRDLITRQLQRQGYQVMTAANGRDALEQIEQAPINLLLLDILMPEMNGYQVLMHLRQRDVRHRIPVIVMSSLDEIDNVVQCIELGAEDYVAKPFNPILLNSKISACLERERLRHREILFLAQSLIAEATPVPVMVTRLADGQILYANPKASESFGIATEELLSRCIQDFYDRPHDVEQLGALVHQQDRVHGYELPCQRADGSLFWVTLSLQHLTFHGEAAALMALCDITDRKQAEEKLQLAEQKYRGIFENALEGIYQASPDGRFLSVNQAMATLYGYDSPDAMLEALSQQPTDLYVDADCRDRITHQVQAQDRIQGIEYQIYDPSGDRRWIHESVQAVRDSAGRCLYYEGIAEDVTQQKREEESLKRQLQELQIEIDQNKRKSQVNDIIQSDYFRELQTEIAAIRAEQEDF